MKEIIRVKDLSTPLRLAVYAGCFSFVFYIVYGFILLMVLILSILGYM